MDAPEMRLSLLAFAAFLGACAWPRPGLFAGRDLLREQTDLYNSKKYDQVVALFNRQAIETLRRADRARAYALLGESYIQLGNIDKALGVYQFAEGLFPKNLTILSGIADLLHRIGLDERAQPYYERILFIHPNNASANQGLAEILRLHGLLPEARARYEKAVAEQSRDPFLWRDYGEVLADRRRFAEALKAMRRSLELSADVDTVLDLAVVDRRQGDNPKAYSRIQEAIRMAPRRGDLKDRLALWRLEDGDVEQALELASPLLQNDPGDLLARWVRASVEIRRKQWPKAREDLVVLTAQRRGPFIAEAAAAMLKELDSL
jgi:tetratricopeptide (TPR) repeat protein